jgi:hypothetical protein
VSHNGRDGNITVVLDFISKGFLIISTERRGFTCTNKLTMEARVGFREFSQGRKGVRRCERHVGAV